MKKLVLFSTTFFWSTKEIGLLYNTQTGSFYAFHKQDEWVCLASDQWKDIDNLYQFFFDESSVSTTFLEFAKSIVDKQLGQILEQKEQVVSLPPALKVRRGIEEIFVWKEDIHNQPVLQNLIRLIVLFGGASDDNGWWRQVVYPMCSTKRLDLDLFYKFLHKCDSRSLTHMDLVISDWDDNYISSLTKSLVDLKRIITFFFAHPDPGYNNQILDNLIKDGFSITQICPPDAFLKSTSWISNRYYHLLVRSEEEYAHWESLLEQGENVDYTFKPIAENNVDFFRANVFLSEEEILGQKLTKKDIFRHQALNVNQFGTFYIFPDGTIHPAADAPAIGTLEDSVHQTIIRELEENHAWRQTRRLISPCKDCIYHDLCPSPSVYERILGVPACTVKQPDK